MNPTPSLVHIMPDKGGMFVKEEDGGWAGSRKSVEVEDAAAAAAGVMVDHACALLADDARAAASEDCVN